MSDIKLFRIENETATEIGGKASGLEKPLQTLIERNLETLLGIRLLASEFSTGPVHGGRIDSLGIDENDCPVVLEYKRKVSENVINQGLYCLDWLMDHQAEFTLLTQGILGSEATRNIDWSSPRLICIASDFTKYDSHAVQQINRNIELIRYKKFGSDLLLLELVNAVSEKKVEREPAVAPPSKVKPSKADKEKEHGKCLEDLTPAFEPLFEEMNNLMLSLGDDVQRKDLKMYVAYKQLRNFATVTFPKKSIQLYLHLDPDEVDLAPYGAEDVKGSGHHGTGDVKVTLRSLDDLHDAEPLIQKAYEGRTP